MAKISLVICDLCSGLNKSPIPYTLVIQSGKGKDKEVKKAEICDNCYTKLSEDIDSEFEFTTGFSRQSQTEKVYLGDGETIIPSIVDNITQPPQRAECVHDSKSYDPPWFKCKECGEEWKA